MTSEKPKEQFKGLETEIERVIINQDRGLKCLCGYKTSIPIKIVLEKRVFVYEEPSEETNGHMVQDYYLCFVAGEIKCESDTCNKKYALVNLPMPMHIERRIIPPSSRLAERYKSFSKREELNGSQGLIAGLVKQIGLKLIQSS